MQQHRQLKLWHKGYKNAQNAFIRVEKTRNMEERHPETIGTEGVSV